MQQPEPQQTSQQTATETLDAAGLYIRRGKTALWVTVSLLALALVVLTIGLISATRTDNVAVSGYYPGITLSFGAFLGIVGIHLVENRRPMLVAAIVFISIGVIASFFCAIVDGIIASEFIDIRPLQEDMCDYYSSGSGYAYDNYYTEVTCRSFNKACKMKLRSNTCYCCYLYNCESTDYHTHYYEFTGVSSCWDVIHLHRLLWASVVLNVVALFLGIINAAILGAYKDMKPSPQVARSPAPPPHILYNPTQHMLSYSGFCPSGQALPAYPNYPIPMQHASSYQTPATPQMIPEGGSGVCPSEESQSQPPTQAPTQPQPQGANQDPGGYMLTPNAPALYGSSYSPFEKPPPYAC
ncbi:transmembrane protein 255B isoform X2 [Cyprinodon tularosa]|uniref:transmembrane protein 255B isoform X2 n=1 Tax=Cyprinodon variegatus TaxID=28743 RepID=UPI0007429E38|nr:PREDICTED: transmembrane protein 255B isoform X2 [Cyprinodon variegatus]XP_038139664.1 transmembrane protein 255B isoform X2 [Cyprinodon tularosa]